MQWVKNSLGAEVTRLVTEGAVMTVVRGVKGDQVPAHGYSRGAVTYVVSGRVKIDDVELGPGDGGNYTPASEGYYGVTFLEDSMYVVVRSAADHITLPDIGERAADNLDSG